jgi:RNA polymerase sigma factor (sigma-70 family)
LPRRRACGSHQWPSSSNPRANRSRNPDIAQYELHGVDWRADGDACAWIEALYREHRRRVLSICRGLLRDRAEAEDAAQQVFLSAYRALLNGAVPRHPAAWLATIARNECVNRRNATTPTPIEQPEEAAVELPDPAIEQEDLTALWDAIAGLPPTQREALLLREIRGLSYDQLAEDLSLSRPSVRSLLTRARRSLHEQVRRGSAALGGMSWLEPLARLFAGGSDAAVSTGAKATVVGVGAAAILGGTLAAPDPARDQPRPAKPKPAILAPAHPAQRIAAPVRPTFVRPPAPVARVATSTPTEHGSRNGESHRHGEGSGSASSGESHHGPSVVSDSGPGSEPVASVATGGSSSGPGPAPAPAPSSSGPSVATESPEPQPDSSGPGPTGTARTEEPRSDDHSGPGRGTPAAVSTPPTTATTTTASTTTTSSGEGPGPSGEPVDASTSPPTSEDSSGSGSSGSGTSGSGDESGQGSDDDSGSGGGGGPGKG